MAQPTLDAAAVAAHGRAGPRVWTVGYEGRVMDDLVAMLRGAGILAVADVRETAWSKKPGFSKGELHGALAEAGIQYVHLPTLGCAHSLREGQPAGGPRRDFHEGYRAHLASNDDAVIALEALLLAAPTALLCLERDANDCHRAVLAQRLAQDGFFVVHL